MFSDDYKRLYSFNNQKEYDITTKRLVESGFYFNSATELCTCHYCGYELANWRNIDVPDIDHLRNSPGCYYIQKKMLSYKDNGCISSLIILEELSEIRKHLKQLTELYNKVECKVCNAVTVANSVCSLSQPSSNECDMV